jgi:hypothetical protein
MLLRLIACACMLPVPLAAEMALKTPLPSDDVGLPPFSVRQVRSAGLIFSGTVLNIS